MLTGIGRDRPQKTGGSYSAKLAIIRVRLRVSCLSRHEGLALIMLSTPSRLELWNDADACLCCFLLCHAGKELLGALAHFRRVQIFFMGGDAPRIAKGVGKRPIAVTPELVGHRH
jgi:hypothetical protein